MSDVNVLESLFFALLERAPQDRKAFLDESCRGNSSLRAEVEELLAAHSKVGGFLEPAAGAQTASLDGQGNPTTETATTSIPEDVLGTVIAGRYKLLENIGEGGMGSVYMAQQTEPVRRMVALKLIKPGMDSKTVLARFEAERQALALMDHPNIAKVLDAGTADSGRPYFIMELVKGTPITQFCDDRKLSPRERLNLFIPVCQAIQHAHQKGIIHRDVKPSNVLVALYDGRPVPKVIDFGVAKATGQSLTDKTLFTGFGAIIGTPEYMSPEQAEVNQLDIDTRSDVYALGVLLYELLTGTTPLDRKRLGKAALLEVLRLVREEEAPRPSTRVSTDAALPTIASNRGIEPAKLTKLMKGELDWIVLKALEKDRTRRYETANGLARDVQRYLADESVEACPPSAGYRLRKFVRRNKARVAAAATVLAVLLMAVAGTTAWMFQARQLAQEAKAEATRTRAALRLAGERYVLAGEAADAFLSTITEDEQLKESDNFELRRKLLTDAVPLLKRLTEDDPTDDRQKLALALAHKRVGDIAVELGDLPAARQSLEAAEAILEALVRDQPDEKDYRIMLGRVQNNLGNDLTGPASEAIYAKSRLAFAELAERYPDNPECQLYWAASLSNHASHLKDTGKADESRKLFEQVIRIATPLAEKNTNDPRYIDTVARAYQNMVPTIPVGPGGKGGDRQGRENACRTAIQWWDRLLAAHPRRSAARKMKALACKEMANLPGMNPTEAIEWEQRAIAEYERLAADFPRQAAGYRMGVATAQVNLAFRLGITGQREEAERMFAAGMDRAREEVARHPTRDNRWSEATTHVNHARHLNRIGDYPGQRAELLTAVGRYEKLVADFPGDGVFMRVLAETLAEAARAFAASPEPDPEKALGLQDRVVGVLEPIRGTGTPDPAISSMAIQALTSRITARSAADRYAEVLADCDRYATWLTTGKALPPPVAFYRAKALIRTGRADEGLEGYEATVRELVTPNVTGFSARFTQELSLAGLYAMAHAATKRDTYAEKAAAVVKAEAEKRRADAGRMKKATVEGSKGGISPTTAFTFNPPTTRGKGSNPTFSARSIIQSFDDPAFDSVRERGDFVRAKTEWDAAQADYRKVMSFENPTRTPAFMAQAITYSMTTVRNGNHALGTRRANTALSQGTPDGESYYLAAGVFALAVGKVPDDPAVRDTYAARAIELLKRAAENGWNDPDLAAKNADLDSIRDRDDFKEIMQSLPERKKTVRETAPPPRVVK